MFFGSLRYIWRPRVSKRLPSPVLDYKDEELATLISLNQKNNQYFKIF